MKKQKDPKQSKRNALLSFLQTSATPASVVQPEPTLEAKKASEEQQETFEEYNEEFTNCNVCGCELEPAKRKKCEFCSMVACSDHTRKRRKKKGKWERICDNCEDRHLYDTYMKLESKAEEALTIEEEITTLKHENFLREVEDRREKRREIGFKTMALTQRQKEQMASFEEQERSLSEAQERVQGLESTVHQLSVFTDRATAAFRENHEQSWSILSEENARMARELTKLEKRGLEIKASIEKKEREIEEAFEAWEQKQFKRKLEAEEQAAKRKKEGCVIY